MKLSFKFNPKLSKRQKSIINELSFHTTKLYNIANYDCLNNKPPSYVEMNNKYKSNWHSEFLHSHNYQQCLKVLEKNWKAYFKAIANYKKNPSKYYSYMSGYYIELILIKGNTDCVAIIISKAKSILKEFTINIHKICLKYNGYLHILATHSETQFINMEDKFCYNTILKKDEDAELLPNKVIKRILLSLTNRDTVVLELNSE